MPAKPLRVAVVGGGIGGLAAANALVRRGMDVSVFEQAPALGEVGAGVFIYPNSLRQLERMGLGPALAGVGARVGSGSRYCRMDGSVVGPIVMADSSGWNGFYGMHRADLLDVLAAALPPGVVHTAHRCVGLSQDAGLARLEFENGRTAEADLVVAADGIHSVLQRVRRRPLSSRVLRLPRLPRPRRARRAAGVARRGAPGVDGRRQALHGLPGPRRPPAQLRRLRPDGRPDRRVLVRRRRPRRARRLLRRVGSERDRIAGEGPQLLLVGPLRPPAPRLVDEGPPGPRRGRRAPHAAPPRPGREPGDRGRRRPRRLPRGPRRGGGAPASSRASRRCAAPAPTSSRPRPAGTACATTRGTRTSRSATPRSRPPRPSAGRSTTTTWRPRWSPTCGTAAPRSAWPPSPRSSPAMTPLCTDQRCGGAGPYPCSSPAMRTCSERPGREHAARTQPLAYDLVSARDTGAVPAVAVGIGRMRVIEEMHTHGVPPLPDRHLS